MAADAIDVTGRTYHTETGRIHLEGETYTVTHRALAETLRGIGFVSLVGVAQIIPPPVLASLTPNTANKPAAPFTLHVLGSGFAPTDVVYWNGRPTISSFVSATELTTPIVLGPSDIGAIPVSVQTENWIGSNALTFLVTSVKTED